MIDGQNNVTQPDQAREMTAWETLLTYDESAQLTNGGLAEEVTAEKADQWLIRIRSGIEFSNGKTLTADDVIYSLQRIANPKKPVYGTSGLASVDPNNIKKIDDRTVRLFLLQPDSTIAGQLGEYHNTIVPVGYDLYPAPQVGTGPYVLSSFTPGQQSVHTRNPNYWRSGQPYFDSVTIINFQDPTSQVNALFAGQVDAMTGIPFAEVGVAQAHGISILNSQTGNWQPLCMAVDLAPFNDNRVRQAFRLIANRPQLVEQVLSGYGRVANDLYSPYDPAFDSSLPQRQQDIEQAKSLLKQAGHENLAVELFTTNGEAGMVEVATAFANQATAAGVTVSVRNDANFYSSGYLKVPFSVDFWGTHAYLPQVANGSIPTAPYNECHWPPTSGPGSDYGSLYKQALAEIDDGKRREIIHQMQTLEYNYGGYIIPYFNNLVDAYSSKVQGFKTSRYALNLDSYGHGYRTIWFA
jgi:peptide/nickel transport system substrate-binding protein